MQAFLSTAVGSRLPLAILSSVRRVGPWLFKRAAPKAILSRREVDLTVDLGAGNSSATFWTCDLTTEYIHINADYRT